MWTGGKPPRIPKEALKKPDMTNSGEAFRPNMVNSELEALKQRGLAKMLNKHFTEEAQKLAQEKAAVDAAMADLEQRKANTSEFHASLNNELSPLDSMYMSVNAWRNECRRKERETLLLYQRYVDKFGAVGQVRLPEAVVPDVVPGPANKREVVPPAANNKEPRSWIIKDDGSCCSQKPAAPSVPPSRLVPTMAAEIERTLDDYIQRGALSLPSVEVLGIEQTYHTTREKEEAEFRNYYRRKLESRGIDAKSPTKSLEKKDTFFGPGWIESLGPGGKSLIAPPLNGRTGKKWEIGNAKSDSIDQENEKDEEDDDAFEIAPFNAAAIPDDCSAVSGLTSVHSQITRSVFMDCERTVYEFLKVEKTEIQKIMEEEEERANAEMRTGNILSAQATQEAENMVKQMQDILDEYQLKHADDVSVNKQSEGRRFYTDNPDEQWMVYYDEFYQQEYYHESNSNRTQWDPPGNESHVGTTGSPGKDASSTGTASDNTPSPSAVLDNASISSGRGGLLSSEDVMPERRSSNVGYNRRMSYESRISQYRRKRRRERKRKLIGALLFIVSLVAGLSYLKLYRPENFELAFNSVENYIRDTMNQTGILSFTKDVMNQTGILSFTKDVMNQTGILSFTKDVMNQTGILSFTNDVMNQTGILSFTKDIMNQTDILRFTSHLRENDSASIEKAETIIKEEKSVAPATGIEQEECVASISEFGHSVTEDNMLCIVEEFEQELEHRSLQALRVSIDFGLQSVLSAAFETPAKGSGTDSAHIVNRPWACNIPFAYLFHPRCFRLAKQNPLFDVQQLVSSMFQ